MSRENDTPDPGPQREQDAGTDEPRRIDLGKRSFADTNIAEDQRRQGHERGEGLGAGSSANRDARHPARDGETPEDDID